MAVIDKNRIFATIFNRNSSINPILNCQDYDETITQPPYPPEDHPDPHHPTPAAKRSVGNEIYHYRKTSKANDWY